MFAEGVASFRQARFVANENANLFDLSFGKIESKKFNARFVAIGRSANDANELIQVCQRDQIALERFCAFFRLAQFETRASKNDFASVFDIRLVSNFEWQQLRSAMVDRQHVHGER